MRPHTFIRTLAVAALIALPSIAMAAPDQNTNGNNNNACRNGQWVNGQCVYNNNNNNNNNNGRHRDRDDRNGNNRGDDRNRNGNYNGNSNNGTYNNGGYNNGGYNNGAYGNGAYGNGRNGNWNYGRGNTLTGTVSSFSPYNLYLNNGQHVELHNGTVINPTGTNLSPGMRVRIVGARNSDGTFNANEIDVVGNGGYRYY